MRLVQQHRFSYNEPMPVESCTQSLCGLALQFGEDDEDKDRMVRPGSYHHFPRRASGVLMSMQPACIRHYLTPPPPQHNTLTYTGQSH